MYKIYIKKVKLVTLGEDDPKAAFQIASTQRCYETIEEMKEAVAKVIDTLTQEDFDEAFQKLL